MSGKRLVWADTLKGILIIIVVLGHSIQATMIKMDMSYTHDYLWNLIYSFHMPAFMAISGFVSYRFKTVGAANGGG